MRRFFDLSSTFFAVLLLFAFAISWNGSPSLASGHRNVAPAIMTAHGPSLPPDPWNVRLAHGPSLPPDPWNVRLAHGPSLPPDPWNVYISA